MYMRSVDCVVSVVIIAYKVADELRQCIESVINQSYKKLEIILVDDGSPDKVPEICDEYKDVDNRIQVIHKNNEGSVFARRDGLLKSTGKYVIIIDGDDYIDSGFIENLVTNAEKECADVVIDSFLFTYSDREMVYSLEVPKGVYKNDELKWIIDNIMYFDDSFHFRVNPSLWNKLFLREKLIKYYKNVPQIITLGDDLSVSYPYIVNSECIVVLNSDQYYHYRQREKSIVNAYDENLINKINCLMDYLSSQETLSVISDQLENYFFHLWVVLVKNAAKNKTLSISTRKIEYDYTNFSRKDILSNIKIKSYKYNIIKFLTKTKQWLLLAMIFQIKFI